MLLENYSKVTRITKNYSRMLDTIVLDFILDFRVPHAPKITLDIECDRKNISGFQLVNT